MICRYCGEEIAVDDLLHQLRCDGRQGHVEAAAPFHFDADPIGRPSPVESTPEEEREETAEAVAAITSRTSEDWRASALAAVRVVAERQTILTTEDVWLYLHDEGETVEVHDHRAMGPIMIAARRAGWIERREGAYQDALRMSHGRPLRLWNSCLCKLEMAQ